MGKGRHLTFLLVCLVGCCYADNATSDSNKPSTTLTWIEKLKKDLFANYDRNVRPTQYYNVTNLNLGITMRHVDIDEENSIFSLYGWVKMSWKDLRLKWNASDYGGIQSIVLPSYYLWDADLHLHSVTLESSGSSFVGTSNVRVGNDGMNIVTERLNFKSFCEMNFRSWPYDTHHCSIVLGKMVADEDDAVQIQTLPAEWERLTQGSSMWQIVSTSVEKYKNPMEVTSEQFNGIQYGITVQRKVQIFQSTIIAPAIVLILMTLATFWLPPNASEKVLLNCINAGIVCAFLLYFTIHLPLLATRTPLVVLFFSNSLYLTAFSLVLSVMVVNMVKTKHSRPVHPYIKGLISLPGVGVFAWTGNNAKIGMTDEEDWIGEMKNDSLAGESCSSADEASQAQLGLQRDWIQFAVILDRICFVVYVFIYSVMAASYLH
ncbi:neuronal acetylcholine receptor subunit alpha-5-like isoform X1 [Ochlerotatus camptorhynchus]|uniref:neuronal acetylcholine receptor subunit alpha-5-like isoform X1 n=1 Tax=Ochlerotatus camptorhynchus TaxID=644619 RepID=UPI0031E36161